MSLSLTNDVVKIPGFGEIALNLKGENIDLEKFFLMSVRKNNKKRNFLFVSQLLGKHIPIFPKTLINACRDLSFQYANKNQLQVDWQNKIVCNKKTLIIGFAETATSMGHCIFDCFAGDCYYVHTTRNIVEDYSFSFEFREEHCHATEQLFFLQNERWINEAQEIIIVDDEVTTGKTIRNLIDQINSRYPNKSYAVFSFLDWRKNEDIVKFHELEESHHIKVGFHSFVQGNIQDISTICNIDYASIVVAPEEYSLVDNGWNMHYCQIPDGEITNAETGINAEERGLMHIIANSVADYIKPALKGTKRAFIGSGEFMYLPLLVCDHMDGENYFNATTRSPAIPFNDEGYGIKTAIEFVCPYDMERTEYLYNCNVKQCDEIVLFFENSVCEENLYSMLSELDKLGYTYKHIVFIKGE